MSGFRVGVDIGGTFTDIVFLNDRGELYIKKVSWSVDNYARAIVDGIAEVLWRRRATSRTASARTVLR